MKWISAAVFAFAVCVVHPALAAEKMKVKVKEKVSLKASAGKDVQVINAKGEKELKRVEARKALPGEVIFYTVTYTNTGKEAAENFVATYPVPEHMAYIDGSAAGANALVTYSADLGKTFAEPDKLMMRKLNGMERSADAPDYTHIRWTLTKAVQPGETGSVSFRAKLK